MQNEPNLKTRATINMKNKPNSTHNAPTKNANRANFTPISYSLLKIFTRLRQTFTQKLQKNRPFCNFLTLTHLTPCTTKTYINFYTCLMQFYPKTPFTRGIYRPLSGGKKCKTNPIQLQPTRYLSIFNRYEKHKTNPIWKTTLRRRRSRSLSRLVGSTPGNPIQPANYERLATRDEKCKTNTICQQKSISAVLAKTYINTTMINILST